jgi:MFS family permease
MALNVRHPDWLSAKQPGASAFALLFLLESFARASLTTVIPLQVYYIFESKETVSLVYTALAAVTFVLNFMIPFAIRLLTRRWAYTVGALMIGLCGALLTIGMPATQVAAMLTRTVGAAAMSVSLNLYIMDNIRKQDYVKSEPLRLGVATLAWTVAPALGAWLFHHYGIMATSALSMAFVLPTIALFWYLRLKEGGPIRKGVIRAPNPFHQIRRFVAQPRLRLAWMIAFARSCYWVTAFIYIPILMVEGGLGAVAGGLAVSAANVMLLGSLVLPVLARRFSVRRMLGWAGIAAGTAVAAAGIASTHSAVAAAVMMVVAALAVTVIDGLGAIPFMRAVRVHERPEMTTVYRTYLDAAELIPPMVYFILFQIAGYAAAFGALGLFIGLTGIICLRYLPARL